MNAQKQKETKEDIQLHIDQVKKKKRSVVMTQTAPKQVGFDLVLNFWDVFFPISEILCI